VVCSTYKGLWNTAAKMALLLKLLISIQLGIIFVSVGYLREYRVQEMCWSGGGREGTKQSAAAGR